MISSDPALRARCAVQGTEPATELADQIPGRTVKESIALGQASGVHRFSTVSAAA